MRLSYNDTIDKICSDMFDIYRSVKADHNLVDGDKSFKQWSLSALTKMIYTEQIAVNTGVGSSPQFIPKAINAMLRLNDVTPKKLLDDFSKSLDNPNFK